MEELLIMKYEYVRIQTMGHGFLSNKTESHKEVIDEYAAKGYRYVGWFPTKSSNILEGVLEEVDLIFEKDE